MIEDLSSYIELFAAVYLTISLDDLLLKRFWTPDYKKKVEESFKDIGMPDVAKQQTLGSADNISSTEETRSRKRGVILFSYSVLLLILIGLESELSFSKTNFEAVGIVLTAFLFSIVFTFDGLFLKNGWRVLIMAIGTPLFVLLGCYFISNKAFASTFMRSEVGEWGLISKVVIVVALLMPVLWQLFRNWIYTRYYLLYIVEQATIKAQEYNYAVFFDTNKGHKMTHVAKPYMNSVAENIAQKNQDRVITPFLNTLLEELSAINYVPRIMSLLRNSYRMHQKFFPSKRRLRKLSKRYDSLGLKSKKPTIEDFCKDNNINLLKLRSYRNEGEK